MPNESEACVESGSGRGIDARAGFSVRRQVRIPVFYKVVELKKDFYADGAGHEVTQAVSKARRDLRKTCDESLLSMIFPSCLSRDCVFSIYHAGFVLF
jgi:hypothetical protein